MAKRSERVESELWGSVAGIAKGDSVCDLFGKALEV